MKSPKYVPLTQIYSKEPDFSKQLSENINLLEIGNYNDDAVVEALVGTRKADIVAAGNDGILVIECQFGSADWDHWGRLEAYARIKEANTAALVAESFEPLMIQTCDLRNQQDSSIDWYLIKALVTDERLHIFQTVAGPAIDIQAEKTGKEYSEFWAPIREKGLFAGKPVPVGDTWITKGVNSAGIDLIVNQKSSKVKVYLKGDNRAERRDRVVEILSDLEYESFTNESPKYAQINYPVMNRGMKDGKHWDEIRSKLLQIGTDIFNKLKNAEF